MSSGSDVTAAERATPAELIVLSRERLRRSDPEAARVMAVEAEAFAREAGDRAARAEALTIIANCLRLRDEYPEALAVALQAVGLCREVGDPAAEARARGEIARVLMATGDTAEALQESLAALEMAEASGDLDAFVAVLTSVGTVYLTLQQWDLAVELCERAAETARLVGDEIANGALLDTAACAVVGLAMTARAEGDEDGAIRHARDATERSRAAMLIARRHGHRRNEGTALANLAEGLALAGVPEQGLALLESWRIDPERDSRYTITHHLDTRGSICLAMGRHDEAIALFTRGLDLAEGKNAAMAFYEHLAEAYEMSGDMTAALACYKKFHLLYCQVASEAAQRNARVAAVRLDTEQAKAHAERERRRADDMLRRSLEDPLTGLANRRCLDDLLAAGVADLAVALVDVDHFKQVNDRHSHQIGDEVLRQLAGLLRAACRSGDLAARYGGEEFAMVFRGRSEPEAVAAAERIRRTVEAYPWDGIAAGLAVTVSIGIAVRSETPLALADRRLYEAKNSGRNRVVPGRAQLG